MGTCWNSLNGDKGRGGEVRSGISAYDVRIGTGIGWDPICRK